MITTVQSAVPETDVSVPIPKEQLRFQSAVPIIENAITNRNELKLSKNLNTSMQKVFEILDFVPEYDELKLMTDSNIINVFKKSKETSGRGRDVSPSKDTAQKLNRDIIKTKDWGNNTTLQDRSINVVTKLPNLSNVRSFVIEKEEPKYRSAFTEAAKSMLSSTKKMKILMKINETDHPEMEKKSKEKKQAVK